MYVFLWSIFIVECMVSSKLLSTSVTWHCLVLDCQFCVVSPLDFISLHITLFSFYHLGTIGFIGTSVFVRKIYSDVKAE